jgi:hypothetical protein
MPPNAEDELKAKVIEYAVLIQVEQRSGHDRIRTLQNRMLSEISIDQWPKATTALDAILGKDGIIHVSETNYHFENVGVANTGEMSGTVAGNSQQINVNENAQALLQAFTQFRNAIQNDKSLNEEQRADSLSVAADLEEEAKKPSGSWNLSKIRNGIAALKTLGSGAQTIYNLYQSLHPFLAAHFNLPS